MPKACNCKACQQLSEPYARDPNLLAFYRKKLLIRGWAGSTTEPERAYVMAHAEWAQAQARRLAGRGGFGPQTSQKTGDLVGAGI